MLAGYTLVKMLETHGWWEVQSDAELLGRLVSVAAVAAVAETLPLGEYDNIAVFLGATGGNTLYDGLLGL